MVRLVTVAEPATSLPGLRIATWNVNSLNVRLPRVLEFLATHAPDVLLMQETKTEPDAFPTDALLGAGYESAHHSAGRWAGVAIAARAGIEDVAAGLEGEPARDEARWLEATVGGTRYVSVYVPNGRAVGTPTFDDKLRFVYDPAAFAGSAHVTPEERERFAALLAAGTVDAFRELHPDEPGFPWWDYRQGHFHRKMGLRIDAIRLSRRPADGVRSAGIDRSFRKGPKPSDHAPLLAELV